MPTDLPPSFSHSPPPPSSTSSLHRSDFFFRRRSGKLNWRLLSSLNLESVVATVDIDSLQSVVENITFSDITEADLGTMTDAHFLQLFRTCQLIVEYLLNVQAFLVGQGEKREKMYEMVVAELEYAKGVFLKKQLRIKSLRQELKLSKRVIAAYERSALLKQHHAADAHSIASSSSDRSPHRCKYCTANFIGEKFLRGHISRRHPEEEEEEKEREREAGRGRKKKGGAEAAVAAAQAAAVQAQQAAAAAVAAKATPVPPSPSPSLVPNSPSALFTPEFMSQWSKHVESKTESRVLANLNSNSATPASTGATKQMEELQAELAALKQVVASPSMGSRASRLRDQDEDEEADRREQERKRREREHIEMERAAAAAGLSGPFPPPRSSVSFPSSPRPHLPSSTPTIPSHSVLADLPFLLARYQQSELALTRSINGLSALYGEAAAEVPEKTYASLAPFMRGNGCEGEQRRIEGEVEEYVRKYGGRGKGEGEGRGRELEEREREVVEKMKREEEEEWLREEQMKGIKQRQVEIDTQLQQLQLEKQQQQLTRSIPRQMSVFTLQPPPSARPLSTSPSLFPSPSPLSALTPSPRASGAPAQFGSSAGGASAPTPTVGGMKGRGGSSVYEFPAPELPSRSQTASLPPRASAPMVPFSRMQSMGGVSMGMAGVGTGVSTPRSAGVANPVISRSPQQVVNANTSPNTNMSSQQAGGAAGGGAFSPVPATPDFRTMSSSVPNTAAGVGPIASSGGNSESVKVELMQLGGNRAVATSNGESPGRNSPSVGNSSGSNNNSRPDIPRPPVLAIPRQNSVSIATPSPTTVSSGSPSATSPPLTRPSSLAPPQFNPPQSQSYSQEQQQQQQQQQQQPAQPPFQSQPSSVRSPPPNAPMQRKPMTLADDLDEEEEEEDDEDLVRAMKERNEKIARDKAAAAARVAGTGQGAPANSAASNSSSSTSVSRAGGVSSLRGGDVEEIQSFHNSNTSSSGRSVPPTASSSTTTGGVGVSGMKSAVPASSSSLAPPPSNVRNLRDSTESLRSSTGDLNFTTGGESKFFMDNEDIDKDEISDLDAEHID